MAEAEKYINLALSKGMTDAVKISPDDIIYDSRVVLKCAWGCDRSSFNSPSCDNRNTEWAELSKALNRYSTIILVHSHDAIQLSRTLLELEKEAFLDGYYLAFAVRACHLCEECPVEKGNDCVYPHKVRPCESLFGIDVYRTVRQLGLPCEVLRNKEDTQNRYGFLCID